MGFKHSLMYGSEVFRDGIGADAGRSFGKQAEFLNSHKQTPTQ